MSLAAGTRLGPYEILAPLGAGGMGEVYRARDERLKREVAVKVLPASLSGDADRMRRFEQEAQAASSLNHPNILAIYDVGKHDGNLYVVSELLEGETLRDRLSGGAFSPRKALGHALQISHGLAAAHEKGIVHRDLKPENLFVTKDGRVKILDFGLAKLTLAPEEGSVSQLATAATQPGVVLGTLSYMAPEQVRGKPADARSDIFAFGAILYEMLSGKRAFQGETGADVMSAILTKDPPDLSLTNRNISPGLERVVSHCLEKDPEQRFHSAHDLAFDLESLLGVSESGARPRAIPGAVPRAKVPRGILFAAAAVTAIALVYGAARIAGFRLVRATATAAPPATRTGPAGPAPPVFAQLTTQAGIESYPNVSPDGKTFLYVSSASGNDDIYLQRIDGRNAINLTKDCLQADIQPAFSPDGSQIAFRSERDGGGIFLMGATGESVRRLTDFGFNPAWSPDGKQIAVAAESMFDPLNRATDSALYAIEVATGAKRLLLKGDAVQPSWSPHGDRIAYWGLPFGRGQRDIWTIPANASSPGSGPVAVTSDAAVDWSPIWSPDGKFLYFASDRSGTMNLWRVPIDEKSGKVLGNPEPMTVPSRWCGFLSISRDGSELLYASRDETSSLQSVAFDPVRGRLAGEPVSILSGSLLLRDLAPSPDGKWVAFTTRGARENLFVISTDGSSQRQLTNDAFKNRGPEWSPDGKRIAFYSNRTARYEVWSVNPDGSGLVQLTKTSTPSVWFPHWSPDGRQIAFPDGTATYLFTLGKPLGEEKPQSLPLFDDAGNAFLATSWSPDGRALAGSVARPDGTVIPGVVLYWIESKKYEKLTDFGGRASFLDDTRRLLLGDSTSGKTLFFDAASRRTVPLFDITFENVGGAARRAVPTRDGKTIFFVKDHTEADIWRATWK